MDIREIREERFVNSNTVKVSSFASVSEWEKIEASEEWQRIREVIFQKGDCREKLHGIKKKMTQEYVLIFHAGT